MDKSIGLLCFLLQKRIDILTSAKFLYNFYIYLLQVYKLII